MLRFSSEIGESTRWGCLQAHPDPRCRVLLVWLQEERSRRSSLFLSISCFLQVPRQFEFWWELMRHFPNEQPTDLWAQIRSGIGRWARYRRLKRLLNDCLRFDWKYERAVVYLTAKQAQAPGYIPQDSPADDPVIRVETALLAGHRLVKMSAQTYGSKSLA